MARTKLQIPEQFSFSTNIPVRITDVNYGGHVGHDTILSMIHEARVQFLHQFGYSELHFSTAGLIMRDVSIEFKNELFYGDVVTTYVTASDFSRVGFAIYYKLTNNTSDGETTIAIAKTGMICYDYKRKKVVSVPEEAKNRLTSLQV
ncbi:MAG: acyl-CoA thioesterase [Chitinophagaceae bacterium]